MNLETRDETYEYDTGGIQRTYKTKLPAIAVHQGLSFGVHYRRTDLRARTGDYDGIPVVWYDLGGFRQRHFRNAGPSVDHINRLQYISENRQIRRRGYACADHRLCKRCGLAGAGIQKRRSGAWSGGKNVCNRRPGHRLRHQCQYRIRTDYLPVRIVLRRGVYGKA